MDIKLIQDILKPFTCTNKHRLELLKLVHKNGFEYVISELKKCDYVKTTFQKDKFIYLSEEEIENAILRYLRL